MDYRDYSVVLCIGGAVSYIINGLKKIVGVLTHRVSELKGVIYV